MNYITELKNVWLSQTTFLTKSSNLNKKYWVVPRNQKEASKTKKKKTIHFKKLGF